ncbi:type I secretion system permease/ATPase [Novosphingobium mangrovi (ex Huang et al. 2023)]|uniref:Type I secretion system permease/ATPase n=1 Tax=Novosphingobium mangrovi (ex Huang et al. 2023) TaxID=2976432 RepID=A0ABT2I1A3_9SPHN|nr:type I secretion system permease/ATPase [Novosphingobium mangrovi (ex Huang et al. 2023)]MCT2398382.1 type I secretion system permease/ATPase [Novosphingobium mangrovi (ex Huang et al. 2023)]
MALAFRGQTDGPLYQSLKKARTGIISVVLLSVLLNILLLGGSIYMMLVYDEVLPSHSMPTLFGLLLMITVVYAFQSLFHILRSNILTQIAGSMDLEMAPRIQQAISHLAVNGHSDVEAMLPVRDIDQIRSFLASPGPTALIDLPWILFFLVFISMLHIWLGVTVLAGAIVMIGLTVLNARLTATGVRELASMSATRSAIAEANRRHAETLRALGMEGRINDHWLSVNSVYLDRQQHFSRLAGLLGGASKGFRQFLQSAVLTVGALLVIRGEASGGIIFASSILSARALGPVDQAIANWRGFAGARDAWRRLNTLIARLPDHAEITQLPAPKNELTVEALTLGPPALGMPTLRNISFSLSAGDGIGIIGPSGSGKSTLARALTGIWQPMAGSVRLDGATIDQWNSDELGRHIGYLPQDVQLFDGTVAQNIARFDPHATSDDIIAAARAANAHDLIVRLPDGYETPVGSDGLALSGGQRQRIALARALFRDPFLLVLDEPNANLDSEGDTALIQAIENARHRGAIVVVIAHRPVVLNALDYVLCIHGGVARDFGPKNDVLSRVLLPSQRNAPPVRVAASA